MGFGMGFGMFNIIFFLIFGIVIVMFIVTAVKGISTWNKNNNSPRLRWRCWRRSRSRR